MLRGAGTASRSQSPAAWDDSGASQPLRADFVKLRGETKKPMKSPHAFANQHYNSLTCWAIDAKGKIKHVYA